MTDTNHILVYCSAESSDKLICEFISRTVYNGCVKSHYHPCQLRTTDPNSYAVVEPVITSNTNMLILVITNNTNML